MSLTQSDLIQDSEIKISKDTPDDGFFNFQVLQEGTWEREKGPDGTDFEVFASHMDFLTAAGGVWADTKGVS